MQRSGSFFLVTATIVACGSHDDGNKSGGVAITPVTPSTFVSDAGTADDLAPKLASGFDAVANGVGQAFHIPGFAAVATSTVTTKLALQGGATSYVFPDVDGLTTGSNCDDLLSTMATYIYDLRTTIQWAGGLNKTMAASTAGAAPWFTVTDETPDDGRYAFKQKFTRRDPTADEASQPMTASLMTLYPKAAEVEAGASALGLSIDVVATIAADLSKIAGAQQSGASNLSSQSEEGIYVDLTAKKILAASAMNTSMDANGRSMTSNGTTQTTLVGGDTPSIETVSNTTQATGGYTMKMTNHATLTKAADGTFQFVYDQNRGDAPKSGTLTLDVQKDHCTIK